MSRKQKKGNNQREEINEIKNRKISEIDNSLTRLTKKRKKERGN